MVSSIFSRGNFPISHENLHLESARHDYFALIDDHFELRRNLDELRKVWQLSMHDRKAGSIEGYDSRRFPNWSGMLKTIVIIQ